MRSPLLGLARTALVLGALLLAAGPASANGVRTTGDYYQESYKLEAAGNYSEALKVIQSLPAAVKSAYIYKLRDAWLNYLMGKYDQAVVSYRAAAAQKPLAIEPLLGMMLPQMAARLWKDAEQTARQVLRMAPSNYLAQSRLAWILFNLGRFAEAERVYRKVLDLFPADLEMQAGAGWSLLKQGKKAEAAAFFSEILDFSPEYATAKTGLAEAR